MAVNSVKKKKHPTSCAGKKYSSRTDQSGRASLHTKRLCTWYLRNWGKKVPCVCENTVIWFIFSHEDSTWRTFCMYWVFYVLWLLCKGGWATTDKNIYLNFPPCALSPLVKSAFFLVWYYVQCKIRKGPLRSYAVQIVEIQFVSFEFFLLLLPIF